jgi:hypothetical protein
MLLFCCYLAVIGADLFPHRPLQPNGNLLVKLEFCRESGARFAAFSAVTAEQQTGRRPRLATARLQSAERKNFICRYIDNLKSFE